MFLVNVHSLFKSLLFFFRLLYVLNDFNVAIWNKNIDFVVGEGFFLPLVMLKTKKKSLKI